MKSLIYSLALVVLILGVFNGCSDDEKAPTEFRTTGEFEPHESIWMGWAAYDNKEGWFSEELQAGLIDAMVAHVKIDLCVQDAVEEAKVKNFLLNHGITTNEMQSSIRFHHIAHRDLWFRDWSGVWMVNDRGEKKLVTMGFDNWGYDRYWDATENPDDMIDHAIAEAMNANTRHMNIVMEAGNFEFNGKGVLIAVEESLKQRNPDLTLDAIVNELKQAFNLNKVILLPHSIGTDSHTVENSPYLVDVDQDGTLDKVYTTLTVEHSDEFVRWIADDKVLLSRAPSEEEALENPINARTRHAIVHAREILESETTADGRNITIIDFPEPSNIYVEVTPNDAIHGAIASLNFEMAGKENIDPNQSFYVVMAASYANFLITNGMILVAKYGDINPELIDEDAEAVRILQEQFPGRTVHQFDPRAINIGGGGIHCITMNMPLINK